MLCYLNSPTLICETYTPLWIEKPDSGDPPSQSPVTLHPVVSMLSVCVLGEVKHISRFEENQCPVVSVPRRRDGQGCLQLEYLKALLGVVL